MTKEEKMEDKPIKKSNNSTDTKKVHTPKTKKNKGGAPKQTPEQLIARIKKLDEGEKSVETLMRLGFSFKKACLMVEGSDSLYTVVKRRIAEDSAEGSNTYIKVKKLIEDCEQDKLTRLYLAENSLIARKDSQTIKNGLRAHDERYADKKEIKHSGEIRTYADLLDTGDENEEDET